MTNYQANRIIHEAYEVLKENEWYWEIDNDYKRFYRYIKEIVVDKVTVAKGNLQYIASGAKFLLEANDRIFK